MILYGPHVELIKENGKKNNGAKTTKHARLKIKCDKCGKIFTELDYVFNLRFELIGKEYCGKCSRPIVNAIKGKKSGLFPNKGRFTTERVNNLSPEEYKYFCEQRRNAALTLHSNLNKDPIKKEEYYKKIFKSSTIGYISKGQREIFEHVKDYGFELEKFVDGVRCDIVNVEKKLVIEYYGDYWHANPRIYSHDTYIDAIKLTAKEKWNRDRKRNFGLRRAGYTILIIWESQWHTDKKYVFEKINKLLDGEWGIPTVENKPRKYAWVTNLKSNRMIKFSELNDYLNNGWFNKRMLNI